MIMELKQKTEKAIQDSNKILIGLGDEFSCDKIELSKSRVYQQYLLKKESENSENVEWMLEYIRNYYLNSEIKLEELNIFKAYKKLFEQVKNKDYYIVSMNSDLLLEKAGFSKEKIVYPCGNRRHMQCVNNCSNEIWNSADIELKIVQKILDDNMKLNEIEKPVCEKCKEAAQYNLIGKGNYSETGYLDGWAKYMEWTSKTLNQNLCALELGVSFKYPTVIRWPFEKIVFINNKAWLIRVNEKFEQVNEELAMKALTVKENSIDFILNNF